MRLAALGLFHEANTFAARPADLAAFEAVGILRGRGIRDEHADAHTAMAGFLRAGDRLGVHVEPLLFARAVPAGVIPAATFDPLVDEMVEGLTAAGPWDGVLLAQHGAAVAEQHPSADGEILRRVRAAVGPQVPIGVVVDLHANLPATVADHVEVMVAYRTNPHVDADERGEECLELVAAAVKRETRPAMAVRPVPVAMDITRQATDRAPMDALLALARGKEALPGVLSVSVAEGYPYADTEHMGMAVIAITDDQPALAGEVAGELAAWIWQHREAFRGDAVSVAAAVGRAASAHQPIVLLDIGDNIGAGAPGDSMVIYDAAVKAAAPPLFQTVCDPGAVATAGHVDGDARLPHRPCLGGRQ